MSATLTKVFGFFYKVGSVDVPFNTSPDDVFGWDSNDGNNTTANAVFDYSLNDCERACTVCRTLTRHSTYTFSTDSAGSVDVLLAEAGTTTEYDYSAIATADITETFWNNVYACLEYLYKNQASVKDTSWDSNTYLNMGDAMLGSSTLSDGSANTYYVSTYKVGSLTYTSRSSSDRLQYVSFSVNHPTLGYIPIVVYFDADAWCERSANITYKVYRYEDLDGDSSISSSEFKTQIVSKLFEILKVGKYAQWSTITVDKRVSDTSTISEQFFVFSSVKTSLTSAIMKEKIKTYLSELYETKYLRYTYPTLFSENEIRIIPMWENQITTASSTSQTVHAAPLSRISTLLTTFGYNILPNGTGYKPTEVFYIGPGSGWSPNVDIPFIFPLLAIEQDSASGIIYPISSRFPSYKPIYGQNETGEASEFHFILLTILSHLNDTTSVLTSDFISEYSISTSTSTVGGNRTVVTFTFAGDIWSVYGPISASA